MTHDEDRFSWGRETAGRQDPQHAARMVDYRQPCERRTHGSNRLPLSGRGGTAAGWMIWMALAVVAGLIAWGIWG